MVKSVIRSERNLHSLVPAPNLAKKSVNWVVKIQDQYKTYSKSRQGKDRSPIIVQGHFLSFCWNLMVYGSAFFTGFLNIRVSCAISIFLKLVSTSPAVLKISDKSYHWSK